MELMRREKGIPRMAAGAQSSRPLDVEGRSPGRAAAVGDGSRQVKLAAVALNRFSDESRFCIQ